MLFFIINFVLVETNCSSLFLLLKFAEIFKIGTYVSTFLITIFVLMLIKYFGDENIVFWPFTYFIVFVQFWYEYFLVFCFWKILQPK